jgi:biotin operon repressor
MAESVCEKAGLEELGVDLISIRGLLALRSGDARSAFDLTRTAIDRLTPGVERPYLIHHRHALAAEAAGEHDEARSAWVKAESILRRALAGLEPAQIDHALTAVPEHREIVARAARLNPTTIEVQLPLAGTPTGRPLQPEELCLVTWTVEHPDDTRIESPVERRRTRLVRLLAEAESSGATPTTEHLARALAVSASTVRRDLKTLREQGHHATTRGQKRQAS